ncbi:MAG: ABC transporter permease [Verrucomicrobiota bacterium]
MFFSPFLALRYLKPKRTAVSIITLISIIGVALGVWITVVVMAVFTGFGETMKRNILGFRPHVEVRSGGYLEDYLEVTDPIAELDGVAHFTPYVFGQVIMDFRGYRRAPQIRAILQPEEGISELELMNSKIAKRKNPAYDPSNPSQHPEEIPAGEFYLDPYNCVIGDALARGMGLNVGDTFLLYSPKDIGQLMDALDKVEESESSSDRKKGLDNIREMTVPQEVTVAGIFDSGENDADSNIIMLHLETGQTLYNFDLEEAHGVSIRVDDPFAMAELEDELLRLFGNQHHVVTWKQANKVLFDAIAWERMMMYLILSLVVIVGFYKTIIPIFACNQKTFV